MLQPMPFSLCYRSSKTNLDDLKSVFGMVKAKVQVSSDTKYPLLCYKNPDNEKMYQPVGEWEGWFTSVELNYGIKNAPAGTSATSGVKVLSISEVYEFAQSKDIFKDYIKEPRPQPYGIIKRVLLMNHHFVYFINCF